MSINPKKPGPFDVKTIEALAAMMSQHDLSEINLREGSQHLRLRRGAVSVGAAAAAPAPALAQARAALKPAVEAAAFAPTKKNLIDIKSESVGTFYAQPKPGDPPYVKLGDRVTPNKAVGVLVVMKTNNEIVANCSGVIVEVLVKDEQFVDFGQTLFRVDPS